MEKRKTLGQRLAEFVLGKGFYIVLLLSALAVGTLAYLAANRTGTDVEDTEITVSAGETLPEAVSAMGEAPSALPAEEVPAQSTVKVAEASPVFVSPVEGEVLRPYSMTVLRYDDTMGDWRTHSGVDFSAAEGSRVCAVTDGVVTSVTEDDLMGTTVTIDHGHGLVSVYANLQTVPAVREGTVVSAGQVIGAVGSTALGESGEASHLHFAMERDGGSVDPAGYIPGC